jgi:site-specific DNA-cytosine methylase
VDGNLAAILAIPIWGGGCGEANYCFASISGGCCQSRENLLPLPFGISFSLSRRGFRVAYALLNSKDFLLPQNRERVYIWACKKGEPDKVELVLRSLQRTQTFEHHHLVEGLPFRTQPFRPQPLRTQPLRIQPVRMPKWMHIHKLMRDKFPMVPAPPGLTGSRRVLECVQLKLSALKHRGVDVERAACYIDAGQSADRAPSRVGCSPCITPNGRIYASIVGRCLTSQECLSYQGIDLHDFPAWSEFSDALLLNLAGNAFSSTVFMCVFLCLLAHVD